MIYTIFFTSSSSFLSIIPKICLPSKTTPPPQIFQILLIFFGCFRSYTQHWFTLISDSFYMNNGAILIPIKSLTTKPKLLIGTRHIRHALKRLKSRKIINTEAKKYLGVHLRHEKNRIQLKKK